MGQIFRIKPCGCMSGIRVWGKMHENKLHEFLCKSLNTDLLHAEFMNEKPDS